jgi:hypothetical protein
MARNDLWLRLLGTHPTKPRLPAQQLYSIISERGRGKIPDADLDTIAGQLTDPNLPVAVTGFGVDELADMSELVATVTSSTNQVNRALKMIEVRDVFDMADQHCLGYGTVALLRAKLGLPVTPG